jgi:hypothetical protein
VSVRSARLQARKALREWHLEAFADPVELLVSELTTNTVGLLRAGRPGRPGRTGREDRLGPLRPLRRHPAPG